LLNGKTDVDLLITNQVNVSKKHNKENEMLWKLKEMEYVEKIADKISNISVSGNGMLIEQLKQIFVPANKSG
jgi:hypothetical protein